MNDASVKNESGITVMTKATARSTRKIGQRHLPKLRLWPLYRAPTVAKLRRATPRRCRAMSGTIRNSIVVPKAVAAANCGGCWFNSQENFVLKTEKAKRKPNNKYKSKAFSERNKPQRSNHPT